MDMKKAFVLMVLVTLTAGFVACGSSATGTLRVKILGTDGGVLTGAKVVSRSQPEAQLKVTGLSGSDGFVTFTGIKTGQYEFTISCAGYVQKEYFVDVASGNREVTVVMERQ